MRADGFWAAPELARAETVGFLKLGTSPEYTSPSSPTSNDNVEQKPSEEVIKRVSPSLALQGGYGLASRRFACFPATGAENCVRKEIGAFLPCKIGEGGAVQVAYNAKGRLLLSIVEEDGILGSNGIDHPIR